MKLFIKRITALLLLAAVTLCMARGQFIQGGVIAFMSMALLAGPAAVMRGQLGAAPDTTDISSSLQLSEIMDSALSAFKRAILPLRVFCTAFQNVPLQGDNKIQVPYYPLQGITSKDFSSSYSFSTGAGSKTDNREITVDKRKYQPITATSAEIARYPRLDLEKLGELKGEKLAYDIIQDVLSLVTAANFGAAVFTGSSSGFDSDDLADIRGACNNNKTGPGSVTDGVTTNTSTTVTSATARFTFSDIGAAISGTGIPASTTIAGVTSATSITLSAAATATATGITFTITRPSIPWPETGRGLVLTPDYDTALMKDTSIKSTANLGSDSAIKEGRLPRVMGFDYAQSAAIPGNSENLVGFASYMSAMLVGFAPITPADQGRIVDYQVVVDPETGIALEYRKWFDADSDALRQVIEANYGRAVGEALALKRIVSA